MQPEKKITKEDTWKADDLRRHIRGVGHEDDQGRRREENERKHRGSESMERRQRDPDTEARRERDKHRERDNTRERAKPRDGEKDRLLDRRKDPSRDRIGERDEREKERRREKDRVGDNSKYKEEDRENRDRKHEREEKENREREKTRERDKEKERTRDRERGEQRNRDKGGEERDREKRREERDRGEQRDRDKGGEERDREKRREERDRGEQRNRDKGGEERDREKRREERDRHRDEKQGEGARDRERQHERERRDGHREKEYLKESERHKDESQDQRKDRERRERHMDREHSEPKEDGESKEQRRKEKETRERRHKERTQLDPAENRRHGDASKEVAHSGRKGSEGRLHGDRERAERDKHKERRQREEGDPRRDLVEMGRTKRTSSDRDHGAKAEAMKTKEIVVRSESVWRSSQRQLSDTEAPVEKEEAPADDYEVQDYEDDFEDYEEDFEDPDESDGEEEKQTHSQEEREEGEELSPQRREEIVAIQRAMDEENKRVGSAQTRPSTEEEERPRRTRDSEISQIKAPQHGKFIDFVAAKRREISKKVASKQKKRSTELLRLIDLDYSTTFSLLDLPPVNEYDMYIKSFGTTNTKQAYVQCNEDNVDRDIQTEEIDVREKWTQHPAERSVVCGGPSLSQEDESTNKTNIDSQRLAKFLRSASQVVVVLLEEDRAERQSHQTLRTQEDKLSFSDGCLQLNTKLPFLHGRPISLVQFSQVQRQTMLSVHSPLAKPSTTRLDSKTIVCVWNIWEPSRPQKILVYESEVCSCCFSPGKATLVFAGTAVGSVVLWDLREYASNHYTVRLGGSEWTFRQPTFSTDAVLATSGHTSSVNSVEAVPATMGGAQSLELPLSASDEESSRLSFQLASLDENGILNLWVVVELPTANEAGSQTNLGLRPGSKVKLLHSSTLHTGERNSPRDAMKTGPTQTLLLKFLPSDSSQFFIGTNMSLVNHGTSHGLKTPPKFYRPQVVGVRPVDVTSINFSPFKEPFFLVGCGDGSVRLHTVTSEQPVMEWSSSTAWEPVVSVQWAQTRPTVFCVLDSASNLHLWDLLENDTEPVITEKTDADRVTAMAVFGDPSKRNTFSGVALARQSGKIEMQYLTKRFTVPDSADLEKLQSLVDEALIS